MSFVPFDPKTEEAKFGILHHAAECERVLRLADFADSCGSFSPGMGESLRKMAAIHSEDAFRWATAIPARSPQ